MPYITRNITHPGTSFRAEFTKTPATNNERGGVGNTSTRYFHGRIARRLHPRFPGTLLRNCPGVYCVSFAICDILPVENSRTSKHTVNVSQRATHVVLEGRYVFPTDGARQLKTSTPLEYHLGLQRYSSYTYYRTWASSSN